MVKQGAIRLQHIGTDEQVAHILTKPLGKVKFLTFREQLGVVERPSSESPCMIWILSSESFGELGVLLGAMSNHRVSGSTFP